MSEKRRGLEDYVTVAERIEQFYERYPEGRILAHIVEHDAERGFILMRAEVYRHADDAQPAATGHAFEVRSEGHVQRTSYIEVCETSSVGRALALCGFEAKRGLVGKQSKSASQQSDPAAKRRMLKGQALAAGGKVARTETGYRVMEGEQAFEVRKNEAHFVVCSCPEFAEEFEGNEKFQCPHIYAVRAFTEGQKKKS